MQVADKTVVDIDYTLKDDSGEVLDSSEGKEPLSYLHGVGNIIPGLEKALDGKEEGESFNISLSPEEGYGERTDSLIQKVPRKLFESVDKLEPGMAFQAQTDAGPQVVTVVEVGDEEVTVDGNHPLAGQNLNFEVTVKGVREASDEEIEHGHVH